MPSLRSADSESVKKLGKRSFRPASLAAAMVSVPVGEVHYTEHVTDEPERTCALLEALHGWRFGAPDAELGGSRVAVLSDGSRCGVRASMHEMEKPLTRSYVRVASAKRAASAAAKKGALVALPPMKLGRHGTIAIIISDGVEHGVWELPRATPKKKAGARGKKGAKKR